MDLQRYGIIKAHWECWSACNLRCGFCYRTIADPLATPDAKRLLKILADARLREIVFCGGDPSLRSDISELTLYALSLGLVVEIQTNSQRIRRGFRDALMDARVVGLSLDGASAKVHDIVRDMPGNFERTIKMLDWLGDHGKHAILRTVVTAQNFHDVPLIAEVVESRRQIKRWSLMEFVHLGDGFVNAGDYVVSHDLFLDVCDQSRDALINKDVLDCFSNDMKTGAYLLINARGDAYTPEHPLARREPRFFGNLLSEPISAILEKLPFNSHNHAKRYS